MTAPRHHRPPIPMTDTTFWAVSWNQYEPSPHGTPARYRNGCDCPLCLDGEARKNRERRGLESDVLLVECRCGQRNVRVPETDVRRGVERLCHACRRRLGLTADRTDVPRETGQVPLSYPPGIMPGSTPHDHEEHAA